MYVDYEQCKLKYEQSNLWLWARVLPMKSNWASGLFDMSIDLDSGCYTMFC